MAARLVRGQCPKPPRPRAIACAHPPQRDDGGAIDLRAYALHRPAEHRRRRLPSSRQAPPPSRPTVSASSPRSQAWSRNPRVAVGGSPTEGACSSTTCALVPLKPNDDTAARRGAAGSSATASPRSARRIGSTTRRSPGSSH